MSLDGGYTIDDSGSSYWSGVRSDDGAVMGCTMAQSVYFSSLSAGESVKIVTHSMGAALAKGFIAGLRKWSSEHQNKFQFDIEFEVDFAPF